MAMDDSLRIPRRRQARVSMTLLAALLLLASSCFYLSIYCMYVCIAMYVSMHACMYV